jgi:sigma-B regulation protein RsbU (phosphoserine phosphatase)
VSEKLATILLHEEVSARNVVYKVWDYMDTPENVMASMEEEIKTNDYTHGYFFAFEPGFFSQYPRWFEPYMKNGEEHVRNIGSAEHDYLSADWYKQAKSLEDGEGFWTEPYLDEVGGKDKLCSFFMPIYDSRKRLAGVWGSDMSLSWLMEQLKEIDAGSYSSGLLDYDFGEGLKFHTFIISQKGTYISHPDKERILRDNVLAHVNQDDQDVIEAMMQGKRGDARITIDGEHSIVFYAPLEYTNWSMAIVIPEKVMLIPPLIMTGIMMLIIIVGLVVVWLFCRSNIRQITSPLGILAQSANEVAKGNFEAPLPTIVHKDEICKLRESFASMQQSLMTYVQDLTEKTAQEAALDRELQLARKLQVSMIPNKYPPYPERTDIDIYGTQKPAKVIGGDLFDFFIRDEQLFFCIGDVSGKGIPAALVMAVVHDSFRIISKHTGDPKGIVEAMNNYLSAENRSSMFCTFFLGVLDLKTHLLRYCNAGHELPILITDEVKMVPVEHNLALGLMEGLTYKSEELQLKPGDVIVVCTDGIKEATNQEEDCFEKERMKASLRKVVAMEQAAAADYVHHLVDDVTAFVGDAPQADDLTMLAIKIRH